MKKENIILDHFILVYHPDHPRSVGEGYVTEQVLVMENHLGRYLFDDEDVKHLDGNPYNNSIINLYLTSSQKEGKVAASILDSRETAKRLSKTFIGCRFQKPCWREIRGPLAKANQIYLPYICSFQAEGDIYHCSHFWKFRSKLQEE